MWGIFIEKMFWVKLKNSKDFSLKKKRYNIFEIHVFFGPQKFFPYIFSEIFTYRSFGFLLPLTTRYPINNGSKKYGMF